MIFYLFGPDTFRSRRRLHELVAEFKKQRDPQGYNVTWLDGKTATAEEIFFALTAMPFLAAKRLVVIENLLASNDEEILAALTQTIKNKTLPKSTAVMIWQGEALSKVGEAKELHTLLQKEKYAYEFPLLTGAKLLAWAEQEIAGRGGKIAREALVFLCQNAGHDSWWLNSLIDQALAYAAGREIALADVQQFLEVKLDDNVFALVDAIVVGNRALASKLFNYQREQGEGEGKIFGLLVWQFRVLLEMADTLEREGNLTSEALAKKLGIHPFVAKKNLAVARRTPLARLTELYRTLATMDVRTKTGVAPQDLQADLFVAKL